MNTLATDATQEKQTRFDASTKPASEQGQPFKKAAPMRVATSFVSSHLESLHPELKSFLQDMSNKLLKLLIKIRSKDTVSDKWNKDDALFPKSTDFKFTLSSTPDIMLTPAFLELQRDCDEIVLSCKSSLKNNMLHLISIERDYLISDVRMH